MVVPVSQADKVDRQMLHRLPSVVCRLVRHQQGVTVVEYALLVALISMAAVASLNNLGQAVRNALTNATNAMS
jgi:Flp pilus assembly pilin Flp